MTDTPSELMANDSFMASLSAGDPGATERWFDAHRTAFPEADVPSRSAPSSRPAGTPEVAQSAIRAAMSDPEFMGKVNSGDPAALRRWDDLHKVAHPEPKERDARGAPPSPDDYSVPPPPPGAEIVPGLEEGFRAASAAFGLGIDQASELVARFYEAAELTRFLDDGAMADMMADSQHQLRGERHVLDAARQVFRRLQVEHPALADAVQQSGAANYAPFIRLLARAGGRHAR